MITTSEDGKNGLYGKGGGKMDNLDDWIKVRDMCRQKIADDKKGQVEEVISAYCRKLRAGKSKLKKPAGWDDCAEIDITDKCERS